MLHAAVISDAAAFTAFATAFATAAAKSAVATATSTVLPQSTALAPLSRYPPVRTLLWNKAGPVQVRRVPRLRGLSIHAKL